jgi:hypothetical protein
MKEDGYFAEMADGYRIGISIALSRGVRDHEVATPRKTVFSTATIDPDHEIAATIRALYDVDGEPIYKVAERLADWGVLEIARQFEGGVIDITALIQQAIPKVSRPV